MDTDMDTDVDEFAPPSILERMPKRILPSLIEQLDRKDLKRVTKLSKRIRRKFLPALLREVFFNGSAAQIAYQLVSFLKEEREPTSGPVHEYVETVTFRLIQDDGEGEIPSLPGAFGTLGDFFRRAPQLRNVLFFFAKSTRFQKACFVNLVGDTCDWTPLKTLSLDNADLMTVNAMTRGCKPQTLESVYITVRSGSEKYAMLRNRHPQLKRLWIVCRYRIEHGELYNNSAWDILPAISQDFKELEWLILSEVFTEDECFLRRHFVSRCDLTKLLRAVDDIASKLNEMPKLVRFAFPLYQNTMCNRLMREDWTSSTKEPLSHEQVAEWYTRLILHISRSVPRLEQICVTHDYPFFFQGIKKPGEDEMTVTECSLSELDRDFEFPGGLLH
ncbi:hypothetical protein FPANT_3268 [Fusarium pseudoanthophilum]|uniref:F-box domain-containing protein n=1 Tax=Fusarium pseudoanthophilum TaxID=48495 RepID=A0A8H5PMB5_9HYPO|nr:hypothetical protein FPANT_3268 [Fusarium pseudoanthophilum]